MVEKNDRFVMWMKDIGIERMSVHIESSEQIRKTLSDIRRSGMKAGVALNPETPLSVLDSLGDHVDFILLMMVNPGFAGRSILPGGIQKISDCYEMFRSRKWNIEIEVDGNVSFDHIPDMVRAGADILVAGTSSLFSAEADLPENMKRMERVIRLGCQMRIEKGF
jgi:ribulose-phosphate 3-epimerase